MNKTVTFNNINLQHLKLVLPLIFAKIKTFHFIKFFQVSTQFGNIQLINSRYCLLFHVCYLQYWTYYY